MIVYLHASQQPITPPWLVDFAPAPGSAVCLCRRETEHGHLVGIGDPLIIDCPPMRIFAEVGDGWQAAVLGAVGAEHLARRPRWCRTGSVTSLSGETWQAPVILGPEGERAFLVRYAGRDFLPVLTPEQERCELVAEAARAAIPSGIDMGPEACQWASVLLAAANHISAEAIAELGLLDGQLVAEVLATALSTTGAYLPPGGL